MVEIESSDEDHKRSGEDVNSEDSAGEEFLGGAGGSSSTSIIGVNQRIKYFPWADWNEWR